MDLRDRAQRYLEITRETRAFGRVELRQTENGDWEFEGLASATDTPYEVEDWLGSYTEEFLSGAFKKTLAERDDVALLVNHEGLPLARTSSGTLLLAEEEPGLMSRSTLAADDFDVQRIVPKMQRGDVTKMSIAFRATRQEWDEDYTYRKIIEARLFDVSIVTFPANTDTWATVRSDELIRRLADVSAEELLVQVRAGGSPLTEEHVQRAAAVLERLTGAWVPLEADPDPPPDPVPAAAQRDTPSTMNVEKARRSLELLKLGHR